MVVVVVVVIDIVAMVVVVVVAVVVVAVVVVVVVVDISRVFGEISFDPFHVRSGAERSSNFAAVRRRWRQRRERRLILLRLLQRSEILFVRLRDPSWGGFAAAAAAAAVGSGKVPQLSRVSMGLSQGIVLISF